MIRTALPRSANQPNRAADPAANDEGAAAHGDQGQNVERPPRPARAEIRPRAGARSGPGGGRRAPRQGRRRPASRSTGRVRCPGPPRRRPTASRRCSAGQRQGLLPQPEVHTGQRVDRRHRHGDARHHHERAGHRALDAADHACRPSGWCGAPRLAAGPHLHVAHRVDDLPPRTNVVDPPPSRFIPSVAPRPIRRSVASNSVMPTDTRAGARPPSPAGCRRRASSRPSCGGGGHW